MRHTRVKLKVPVKVCVFYVNNFTNSSSFISILNEILKSIFQKSNVCGKISENTEHFCIQYVRDAVEMMEERDNLERVETENLRNLEQVLRNFIVRSHFNSKNDRFTGDY